MAKIYSTDTFGGELNYSWIKSLELPENCSVRKAIKLFKEHYGYTCRIRKVIDTYGFIRWNIPNTCIAIVLEHE